MKKPLSQEMWVLNRDHAITFSGLLHYMNPRGLDGGLGFWWFFCQKNYRYHTYLKYLMLWLYIHSDVLAIHTFTARDCNTEAGIAVTGPKHFKHGGCHGRGSSRLLGNP